MNWQVKVKKRTSVGMLFHPYWNKAENNNAYGTLKAQGHPSRKKINNNSIDYSE